jgi:hypothetical protein
MSPNAPTIEWYIARDGVQHGPISDAEMRKFVELGHLRATDLVWCARFTEWMTGQQAFPDRFQPRSPVAPAAVVTVPSQAGAASAGARPTGRTGADDAAWAEAMKPIAQEPAADPAVKAGAGATLAVQPYTRATGPDVSPSAAEPSPSLDHTYAFDKAHQAPDEGDADRAEPRRKRGWLGLVTASFAVLLIMGGAGWFAWQNRANLSSPAAIGGMIGTAITPAPSSDFLRSPPYSGDGDTPAEIDASLQKAAVWRFLKKEFADWYQEITTEVARMRAQKQDERNITQYLVNVIVTLRRRNALAALQSSPEHLRAMAGAFVTNLKQLGSRDGATCYAFITHGEASPFMIELSRTPAFAETLQKQMIAVFSAVVDARAGRKIHPNTRRTDYDALTEDLTKQRGWTQQDLATFSDPQKLSTTLPDKVCTLVQDWFVTQLALKDPELQTRLLAESLKPLVGG